MAATRRDARWMTSSTSAPAWVPKHRPNRVHPAGWVLCQRYLLHVGLPMWQCIFRCTVRGVATHPDSEEDGGRPTRWLGDGVCSLDWGTRSSTVRVERANYPLSRTFCRFRRPSPTCRPISRQIAFTVRHSGPKGSRIYVLNCDGTTIRSQTPANINSRSPSFSPDGRRIAFSGPATTVRFTVHGGIDGLMPVNLTNNAADDTSGLDGGSRCRFQRRWATGSHIQAGSVSSAALCVRLTGTDPLSPSRTFAVAVAVRRKGDPRPS